MYFCIVITKVRCAVLLESFGGISITCIWVSAFVRITHSEFSINHSLFRSHYFVSQGTAPTTPLPTIPSTCSQKPERRPQKINSSCKVNWKNWKRTMKARALRLQVGMCRAPSREGRLSIRCGISRRTSFEPLRHGHTQCIRIVKQRESWSSDFQFCGQLNMR